MSWLAWQMWLDLATGKWGQAFQAARTAGRHQNSEQESPTQAGLVGEHCHPKQPGIFLQDIPKVEDFPGGTTEGSGTGRAMVGAEWQARLSGRMESVSTDAVWIGPEKGLITRVLATVIEKEDSIHIDQHLLRL